MSTEKTDTLAHVFLVTSVVLLLAGLTFGLAGGLQYIFPLWMKDSFPFTRLRPLHVSLVISWIFTAASGGIYYYLPRIVKHNWYSLRLGWMHYVLMVTVIILISFLYASGTFGGREYLEFPPWLGLLILSYWTLFLINFFRTVFTYKEKWPVYLWMWCSGILFFAFTFLESQLWIFSFFRDNLVRDTTVQWKALGSMVGSWNMLVYGTAFYLMEQISGNSKVVHSKKTFFFFFLGLTNLMFNWGHHTYIVPASPWIKNISYIISMTELLILGNILYQWKGTVSEIQKNKNNPAYLLLSAADVWVFLNLILAILLSVPAINNHTHGTHFTVAHAMGTTIGINTMILLASVMYIQWKSGKASRKFLAGMWTANAALFIFWIALLGAGWTKALYQGQLTHQQIISHEMPYFYIITFSGFFLLIGVLVIISTVDFRRWLGGR